MKEGGAKPAGVRLWKAWCSAMVAGLSLALTATGSEGSTIVGSVAPPTPETGGGRVVVGPAGSSTVVWRTGMESDLTIDGRGFFLIQVQQPTSWAYLLTRTGDFRVDEAGRLVTVEGGRLMGFASEGTALEPVTLKSRLRPDGFGGWKWTVAPNGDVTLWGVDDLPEVVARIALAVPEPASRLQRVSERDFRIVGMEHEELPPMQRPGAGEAGTLRSGEVEAPVLGLSAGSFDRSTPGDSQVIPVPIPFALSVTLDGPGCLVVRDPVNDERFMTRCGLLKLDSEGWLVTEKRGYRVQGFTDSPFPGVRDLRVPLGLDGEDGEGGKSDLWVDSVLIDVHGYLQGRTFEGVWVRLGRLKIDRVANPGRSIPATEPFWKVEPAVDRSGVVELESARSDGGTIVRMGLADPRYLDEEALRLLNQRYRFLPQVLETVASPTSLAITGRGQFLVRDPVRGVVWMTRSGRFQWSADGFLENDRGWRVQGLRAPWLHYLEDVWVPVSDGMEGAVNEPRTIGMDGKVRVLRTDGSEIVAAWIMLASEVDPSDWDEDVALHFRLRERAGVVRSPRWNRPGERGLGEVFSGALENLSGVQDYLPAQVPQSAKQVVLWGLWGRSGRIQFSSDLKGWRDWMEFRGTDGELQVQPASGVPGEAPVVVGNQVLDASVVEGGSRFYRIVADEENIGSDAIFH